VSVWIVKFKSYRAALREARDAQNRVEKLRLKIVEGCLHPADAVDDMQCLICSARWVSELTGFRWVPLLEWSKIDCSGKYDD